MRRKGIMHLPGKKQLAKGVLAITMAVAGMLPAYTQEESKGVNIGLCYPISNRGMDAALYSNVFSFHALVGVSRNENGVSIAGISNVIRGKASGVQVAGFTNHIANRAAGVQVAGFTNLYNSGNGIQVAGFTNLAKTSILGAQVSGFYNRAGAVKGIQLAGFVNTASNVKGLQVAGFVNKAKSVKGIQVAGFLNIADSSDFPIGLVNLVKNGERSLGISVDETATTTVAFRSGGRVLYGILGIGYNLRNKKAVYGLEAGMGAHFRFSQALRLNTELVSINLSDFKPGAYFKTSFRLLPSLRFGKTVELFGGPSLNFLQTNTAEGQGLVNKYVWQKMYGEQLNAVYIGWIGGLQFRIR